MSPPIPRALLAPYPHAPAQRRVNSSSHTNSLAPDGRDHELYLSGTRDRVQTFAADGRYELLKTTTKYDGKVGREQHHFPPVEKLPV